MASQQAKFIDVTKTFIPLDPKAFPVSMHGTTEEDSPEQKIPVMAYEGKNIIPTARGYSSYFGLNRTLGIDPLPARCSRIFIVQNEFFRNTLVALTEQGIYIKQGNSSGPWVHAIIMPAPFTDAVHHDWTVAVIANTLYCYRQGWPSYQKVVGNFGNGVAITSIVPNFLNMTGQIGIFAAGGRLGFWDSADSTAWSNLDDFADFTPSILTLANIVKFSDINGRIVTIQSHGAGYIIYCTKSIVFVRPNVEAAFQWDPSVIFSGNGITYTRQIAIGSPDTIHFAYTNFGLYKIENGREELIVPEVTDMLEDLKIPKYLRIMEGRYLFIEIMDPNFLSGLVQFSAGTINDNAYVFPGVNQTVAEAVASEILQGTNMCLTLDRMNDGTFAPAPADPGDKKPNTSYRPRWVAYLSKKGQWGPVTDWHNIPVATIDPNGQERNQCPVQGDGNKLSANNTTSVGKTVVQGSDLYLDGIWTMERFVAVQQAIWDLEEDSIDAFINSIIARSSQAVKTSYSNNATTFPEVVDKQLIGTYARRYTKGYFGFSACEFWLTRYCYQATKIFRIKRNVFQTTDTRTVLSPVGYMTAWQSVLYPTVNAAMNALWEPGTWSLTENVGTDGPTVLSQDSGRRLLLNIYKATSIPWVSPFVTVVYAVYQVSDPFITTTEVTAVPTINTIVYSVDARGRYQLTESMFANNREETYDVNPFVPDTGYCTLVGWDYTRNNDTTGSLVTPDCTAPSAYPPNSENRLATAMPGAAEIGDNGSFCSIPFQPVTIPGTPPVVVNWPTQTITSPGGSFLLQDGSIAPVYPTMYGALVYDLHLKKWGRMDQTYKLLLDYSPINNANPGTIPYASFGIMGGILAGDGSVKLFDDEPNDSYITYGKIGFYRLGMTSCEEATVQFSKPATGFIKIDTSLNGAQTETTLTRAASYANVNQATVVGAWPGSWQNITIGGHFDIKYLEYRGFIQGKR